MKANEPMRQEFIINPEATVRVELEEHSCAEYVVLQSGPNLAESEVSYEISLQEGASLKMVFLSLDGTRLRNHIKASLRGRQASCELGGLCLAGDAQEMDFDVLMTHLVPECRSSQLFKNIIGGSGVTRFEGLIKVVRDAQKTEAYQANHNLLTSDAARAFTRPQLEIYADDVKCSHGATTGRLNPDELFYMRSRGISADEAVLLQQMAFAAEVVGNISDAELRDKMLRLVEECLKNKF